MTDASNTNAEFALGAALYRQAVSQAALGYTGAGQTFDAAVKALDGVVKRDPDNLLWLSALVDALIGAGQKERAEPLARQLAERQETTADELIRHARQR